MVSLCHSSLGFAQPLRKRIVSIYNNRRSDGESERGKEREREQRAGREQEQQEQATIYNIVVREQVSAFSPPPVPPRGPAACGRSVTLSQENPDGWIWLGARRCPARVSVRFCLHCPISPQRLDDCVLVARQKKTTAADAAWVSCPSMVSGSNFHRLSNL